MGQPLVVQEADVARSSWDDPQKGVLGFRTLISGGTTATEALTAGISDLGPGGWLGLHRHTAAEIYYVVEGNGVVTLDGVDHPVSAGTAVYIPGDAEHGIRNSGQAILRFFYAFAVDSFDDIVYRFSRESLNDDGQMR
jgi:mannose-6-phosphate isomerase-like protein (cupin superfamily)